MKLEKCAKPDFERTLDFVTFFSIDMFTGSPFSREIVFDWFSMAETSQK